MKKLISVALVLMMVVALATASFSAAGSPTPTEKAKITVSAEGNGTASADKSSVVIGEDGIVTVSAVEAGGYFTKWIIEGQIEPVEGDEYTATFTFKPLGDVTAIASFSVDPEYLTISGNATGDGSWTATPNKVLKGSGETVTLTATEANDPFVKWVLECQYDVVSGSLTEKTLVIRPYTDINVTAVFGSDTPSENPDDDNTSPKTGDNTVTFIAIVLMAMALGMFAVKKIKE